MKLQAILVCRVIKGNQKGKWEIELCYVARNISMTRKVFLFRIA